MFLFMFFYTYIAHAEVFNTSTISNHKTECIGIYKKFAATNTRKTTKYADQLLERTRFCGTVIEDTNEALAHKNIKSIRKDIHGDVDGLVITRLQSVARSLKTNSEYGDNTKLVKELNYFGSKCLINYCLKEAEKRNLSGQIITHAPSLSKNPNIAQRCESATCHYDKGECRSDRLQFPITEKMCKLKSEGIIWTDFAVFDVSEIEEVQKSSGYKQIGGEWISPETASETSGGYDDYTKGSN